jgi:hypothetical protein
MSDSGFEASHCALHSLTLGIKALKTLSLILDMFVYEETSRQTQHKAYRYISETFNCIRAKKYHAS